MLDREKLRAEFREYVNENKLVKNADLSEIDSDEDAYTDFHNILLDKKNKRLLMTNYYGDDKNIIKQQEMLNKELKKYSIVKALYMFDDKDNKYRNTLFELK